MQEFGGGHRECDDPRVAHGDRLSALDASFLHLEDAGAPMHVASIMAFAGPPPAYADLVRHVAERLHLVPRYRQRLAPVPFEQGRAVWVDDPHFNLGYHLRHTALPAPGHDAKLKALAGRLFAQRLDRTKPLWEMWLVEGCRDTGFALISKAHHALVDGISGVDLTATLLDTAPNPLPPSPPARPWTPRPLPSRAQLLADALVERVTVPGEAARALAGLLRGPGEALAGAVEGLGGLAALTWAGVRPAPPSPLNVPIGPHRRYTWVDAELDELRTIRAALGGTINDLVLAAVAGALGRFLRGRGEDTSGLVLRALVPVSVRAEVERGALGNRVAATYAPLPVGLEDPAEQLAEIRVATGDLKASGQAVGAQVLTRLAGFAPPTILAQAARLVSRQPAFNLVVTNVPGPQLPLYTLGREMQEVYPVLPLSSNTSLGVALLSYNGTIGFGLLGDYDTAPDLGVLAEGIEKSIAELGSAAD